MNGFDMTDEYTTTEYRLKCVRNADIVPGVFYVTLPYYDAEAAAVELEDSQSWADKAFPGSTLTLEFRQVKCSATEWMDV